MKPTGFFVVLAMIVGGTSVYFCKTDKDATPFHNGQVLQPDMVHQCTMTVRNADLLNHSIKYVATDQEINDLLHIACDCDQK